MSVAVALLVSADPVAIQQFSHALKHLSISADVCQNVPDSIRLLNSRKFDAVIVDLQLGEQAGLILDGVRLSPSNRTAVTLNRYAFRILDEMCLPGVDRVRRGNAA